MSESHVTAIARTLEADGGCDKAEMMPDVRST